ncbi:uncharacterized protein LOC124113730 [Haliotis rufescens]|uniref:uncharacterized protein LOC124113730 n=1 Tax=Haliotis rufescens TaxID=6454 RepID=UPI00201EC122|nr:uncharacterized protein LOC124113730 [Haliotis rufescens]
MRFRPIRKQGVSASPIKRAKPRTPSQSSTEREINHVVSMQLSDVPDQQSTMPAEDESLFVDNKWRLHNFTISVYTEDPTTTPTTQAKVCAVYPGTVGAGAREVLPCGSRVRGQYLRIQKNEMLVDDALQFCELEIYATESSLDFDTSPRTGSFFLMTPSHRLAGTPLSQRVGTRIQCGLSCDQIPRCFGFNFQAELDSSKGHCKLMSNPGSDPVHAPSWNWYHKRC